MGHSYTATVEWVRDGAVFTARKRGDLAYNGHYRVFRDLTEATNLDLGLSYADGPNDSAPDARTRLQGLDATLRYDTKVAGWHALLGEREPLW